MALATRCPNCHALFRVVADQLKLRGGLVRCGACHHVFDAIGTLSYLDDAVLSTAGHVSTPPGEAIGATASSVAAAIAPPGLNEASPQNDAHQAPAEIAPPALVAEAQEAPPSDATVTVSAQSWAVPTGSTDTQTEADEPAVVPLNLAAASTVAAPARVESAADSEATAPAFLREASASRRRGFSILFGGGAVLLSMLALAQLAVVFRAEILVRMPQARPALTQLCQAFRCTVNWPARGDLLAVVGSELQALPGTSAFELSAVLRNRGSFTLALPAIELTLTDTLNRTVARKVFAPVDYLAGKPDPQGQLQAGLAPGADLTITIAFEARGLNAAGFVVYPFYL